MRNLIKITVIMTFEEGSLTKFTQFTYPLTIVQTDDCLHVVGGDVRSTHMAMQGQAPFCSQTIPIHNGHHWANHWWL